MLAANRVGKTEGVGGYEVTCHLTGNYPKWWPGRKFTKPNRWWVAGDTNTTVRDILQYKLMGPIGNWGTGLIPAVAIGRTTRKPGITDAVDTVWIKHASGGESSVSFKSYEGGRESFQGTEQDGIWLDEEPPQGIYTECLLRTMTNNGIVILTFTPLNGMSDVVLSFLPGGKLLDGQQAGNKFVVMATWDDAPHLSEEVKKELWASIPPFQRDARAKGIPQLGSGAIYPVPESDLLCEPFEIPEHFPKGFGMDTDQGAGYTAAVWAAQDRETGTVYIYDIYKRGRSELAVHVDAIKRNGTWIPGVGDAAALIVTNQDAQQLIQLYRQAGIDINLPNKAVEAGLQRVYQLMCLGKLKVFKTCQQWFEEFRLYRRDEHGRIVKENDHLMDATRYLVFSGISRMRVRTPVLEQVPANQYGAEGWML